MDYRDRSSDIRDILQEENVDRKYITMLTNCTSFADYAESVLLDERLSLNDNIIYNFLVTYFPKVAPQVLSDHTCQLIETLVHTLGKTVATTATLTTAAFKLHSDLRALSLVYSAELPVVPPPELLTVLNKLIDKINQETEESPTKKRKIEEECPKSKEAEKEEKSEESSKEEAKASCSKDKDSSVGSEESSSNEPEVDWLDRLHGTVTSLIEALQQKHAREEPT